jgi:uncharacterized surface protein with fasciclin (FAS1) repeats
VNIGSDVTITDNDPDFGDANITDTDILGSNGVIHIIDAVILPVDVN